MKEQHSREQQFLNDARQRGWFTLDQVVRAASHSPPDAERATGLGRELGLELSGEGDPWQGLSSLAGEEASPDLSREARLAAGDLPSESVAALYLREIGRTPLLTAEEEIQLAREREAGLQASALLQREVDDPAERACLEEQVRRGEAAHRRMIESNLRLCVAVARKYLGRGLPFLDLVQEGNLGLQRAVEKYDWRKGFRFSTYAYWWIRQAVSRSIAEQGRTIRLPVHVIEHLTKLYNAAREIELETGRPATEEEIARRVGMAPERVREAFRAAQMPISLEAPLAGADSVVVGDFIADAAARAPAEAAESSLLQEELLDALAELLSPREAMVVRLRFGLGDDQPKTLGQIGRELGISRERVRQIEAEAMAKLRRTPQFRELFRDYVR